MNPRCGLFAVLLAGGVLASAHAWADRLLLVEGEIDAHLIGVHQCGLPVTLVVTAGQPDLFEGEAAALQRLVDGARAMLGFECPDLQQIEVQGRLRGLDTNIYRGIASRTGDWKLDTLDSIRSHDAPSGYSTGALPAGSGPGANSSLEVAGISMGMTVEEVSAAVRKTFGGEPQYEPALKQLTFSEGGCPLDYDPVTVSHSPEAGWKCLHAWFGDERQPRLYRLELVQVVADSDKANVEQFLEDRFGTPVNRWTERRDLGGLWGNKVEVTHYAWGGGTNTSVAIATHELQAEIHLEDDLVVTRVVRVDTERQPAPPARTDLKL